MMGRAGGQVNASLRVDVSVLWVSMSDNCTMNRRIISQVRRVRAGGCFVLTREHLSASINTSHARLYPRFMGWSYFLSKSPGVLCQVIRERNNG